MHRFARREQVKNDHHEPVRPVSPLAGYVGGKRILSKLLVPLIQETPHALYAEPFMGMGGVFFRRVERPKVEAVNDLNRDVATFFRILQRHYQAFLDMLRWQIASRAEFERLLAQDPATLTDLERAARFLYLQRLSFGGKVVGRSFGISTSTPAKWDITRLVPMLEAAHERLAGVTIDCLDWRAFIDRWDRPQTLFFVDPPYLGSEHYYGREAFSREAFAELASRLRTIEGRFILTINDTAEARALFGWASIEPARLTYRVSGAATEGRELIIQGPPR